MKLIFTSLFLVVSFMAKPLMGQDLKDPVQYLRFIADEQEAISKDLWSYTRAVAHGKRARKVEKRRTELINTTLNAERKISRMPAFKGDISFRDSAVSYLRKSKYLLKEDYARLVDMEEIAEQSYDDMEAFLLAKEKAYDKLDKAGESFHQQFQLFADNNAIKLSDNKSKLSEKLEKSGSVFKYYNHLYLIFFKSYKQEIYLMEAMERGDVNAMEQNKNSLISFAEEGLNRLDTIPRYKSDATLKIACIEMMNFYKMEASDKFPQIIDFYLKKEKFENLKKAFDAKKQSEITQADVDQYNNAINEFNQAVDSMNKTNNELNRLRSRTLDNWNNTVEKFLDKNTPK